MTKTKAQLRREAVERLKDYEGWHRRVETDELDPDLLMAVIGVESWDATWQGNRDVLIDLLTDDTHEARGSYEGRLHDVPVSECPYCGCERVVIHDFNDIYEKPHSYRVEHIDEKEAFNAGCFESYYAFDSVEKAVEHANMRDLLTDDEPETVTRDGIEEIMRNLAAEVTNGGVEIHGAIPIEDALKSAMQRVDDLLTDGETDVGESIQNDEKDKFDTREKLKAADRMLSLLTGNERVFADDEPQGQDSREILEEDVREWCENSGIVFRQAPQVRANTVIEWLDRQAAITRAECSDEYINSWDEGSVAWLLRQYEDEKLMRDVDCDMHVLLETEELEDKISELQEQVDALKAEREHWRLDAASWKDNHRHMMRQRDKLLVKVDALEAELREVTEQRNAYHYDFSARTSLREQVKKLEAENAELSERVGVLKAERDVFRDDAVALKSKADALEADKSNWQDGYYLTSLTELEEENRLIRERLRSIADDDVTVFGMKLDEVRNLQAKVVELEAELELANSKKRALKAHIQKMQSGRNGWHIKAKQLEVENARLREKLAERTCKVIKME